jgi:hypothetical protein
MEAMAGIPPNAACGGLERRARAEAYIDHLAKAHPATLRAIGFLDASTLERLPKYPLQRIHRACVEREALDVSRQRAEQRATDVRDVG